MKREKIINGQVRPPYKDIPFGKSSVGFSGCGAIAIYNLLTERGSDIELEDVINVAKRLGCLFVFGFFGIRPAKLKKILSYYNLDFKKIKFEDEEVHDGDSFVVTIFNDKKKWIFGGLHTFEIAYRNDDRFNGRPWIAYNRVSSSDSAVRYKDFKDILITYGKKGERIYGKYLQVLKVL